MKASSGMRIYPCVGLWIDIIRLYTFRITPNHVTHISIFPCSMATSWYINWYHSGFYDNYLSTYVIIFEIVIDLSTHLPAGVLGLGVE